MASETVMEMAQKMIAQLEAEIELRRKEIRGLLDLETKNQTQLKAWQMLLEAEDDHEAKKQVEEGLDEEFDSEGYTTNNVEQLLTWNEKYKARTKISFVYDYLKLAGREGLTPKELTQQLQRGTSDPINPSFAGNALFKLKERGEAIVADGRYIHASYAKYIKTNQKAPEEAS
jgi:hypothetical protein